MCAPQVRPKRAKRADTLVSPYNRMFFKGKIE
jgi:hypothetical protein